MMPVTRQIAFEAFGVPVAVVTNLPDAVIEPLLPPFWRPADAAGAMATFILEQGLDGRCSFGPAGADPALNLRAEIALDALERELRTAVALNAPHHVFLHAGAVAHNDIVILIPGSSFSGKTTLVAALVRAGAEYLSDEFAPIDEHGLVHPFPKPLGVRDETSVQVDHDVRNCGGRVADRPLPIGAVILAGYAPGATWSPEPRSAGETALALIEHAVPTEHRPRQTVATIARALEHATILAGERGEADALARHLLDELDSGRAA